jgi:hypothetical protein
VTISAADPGALYTVKTNALTVVGAALDRAPWTAADGSATTLGASFERRYAYHDKPPWDTCGQLVVYLGRAFTGQQGAEQFLTANPYEAAYGFHTVDLTVEAVTCVAVQQTAVPPSEEQMGSDTQFIDAVGWCLYVGLLQAVEAKTLTPLTPAGRVLVGPLTPSGARGGYAAITCGLSIQL